MNRIIRIIQRIVRGNKRSLYDASLLAAQVEQTPHQPTVMTQRDMIKQLLQIPHWEQKMKFYNCYEYFPAHGTWQNKLVTDSQLKQCNTGESVSAMVETLVLPDGKRKIHYGCGGNLIEGWLNVDLHESDASNYRRINLIEKHPFPDNTFLFAYAEDVLEHLSQAESIFFLAEIYRTLATDGVARLSFPGLEGVLRRHYSPLSEKRVREAEFEAYSFWDHIHFYSQEEIRLVAIHLGFRQVEFHEYAKSSHPELCGLDTRIEQKDLNIIVELTK